MRHLVQRFFAHGLVIVGMLISSGAAQAQIIWGGEAERGFRPGASTPYDGEPITQRYNYGTGSYFFPFTHSNLNGNRLNYLDYADRLERAHKFGYPVPRDPFSIPPAPPSAHRPRVGVGFGWFRRY